MKTYIDCNKISNLSKFGENHNPDFVETDEEILLTGNYFLNTDQKKEVTKKQLVTMVNNFDRKVYKADLPVDIEHERGKAVGWIRRLQVLESKNNPAKFALVATILWNENGINLINSKDYRYLSSEVSWYYKANQIPDSPKVKTIYDNKSHGAVLLGLCLTNYPAIEDLPPVVNLQNKNNIQTTKNKDKIFLRRIDMPEDDMKRDDMKSDDMKSDDMKSDDMKSDDMKDTKKYADDEYKQLFEMLGVSSMDEVMLAVDELLKYKRMGNEDSMKSQELSSKLRSLTLDFNKAKNTLHNMQREKEITSLLSNNNITKAKAKDLLKLGDAEFKGFKMAVKDVDISKLSGTSLINSDKEGDSSYDKLQSQWDNYVSDVMKKDNLSFQEAHQKSALDNKKLYNQLIEGSNKHE